MLPVDALAGAGRIIDRMQRPRATEKVPGTSGFLGASRSRSDPGRSHTAEIGLGGHCSTIPSQKQVIAGKVYELVAIAPAC